MRYIHVLTLSLATSAMLLSSAVFAQQSASSYPSKSVTLIVPFAPGGGTDIEARLYAKKASEFLRQQFILDYKPGAGTTIGAAYVAKAAPDGYTLLVLAGAFTIVPALYKDLPYDPLKDFAPVSLMSQKPTAFIVQPAFPAKNIREYVAYAKANPGKINFATTGAGGVSHLVGAWLHSATNTRATFLHYKGTGTLLPDLFRGRVDATAAGLLAAMPLIKAGKVRALAVTDERRSRLLPELQTIAEQGVAGYNFTNWLGFAAPGATPAAIVNKLSEGFAKVAKAPDMVVPFEAEGGIMIGSTPAQLRQLIVRELAHWRKLVQEANIKMQE